MNPGIYTDLSHRDGTIITMNVDQFWTRVDKTETCWLWTASKTTAGYGNLTLDGKQDYAHRVSYRLMVGPIPAGLHVDHLCRVRHCVNPEHLEVVTHAENVRRGLAPFGVIRTECKRGHDITNPANVRVTAKGSKQCLVCHQMRVDTRAAKRREGNKGPWPRTHCPQGHEYTPDNTQWSTQGHRRCAECNRIRGRENHAKKLAAR